MKSFSCSCLGKVFLSNSLQICFCSCEQFCSLEIPINFFFFLAKLNLPSRVNFVQLSFNFKVSNTHLVTKTIDFSHKNWLSL